MNASTPARRSSRGPTAVLFAALLSSAPLLVSCGDGFGPVEGEPPPPLEELDFSRVSPAGSPALWELRSAMEGTPHRVIGEGGTRMREEIDPDLLAAFDATTAADGFGPGCPPVRCYLYFVVLDGTEIETARTTEEAVDFLGSIGSAEEAALVAAAHGYHWGQEPETGSVRPSGDGFELVVLRTVELCDPVRTDRFRLRVSASGELSVRDREVWRRDEGVCI